MKYGIENIKGVIPALVTSFDENEKLDKKRIRAVVRNLLDEKVDGLYITGSTGETFLMTNEERKEVLETVVDEVNGKVPVIAHIGDIGVKKSIDLAQHAYRSGVDAISSVPPFYWKFSADEIYQYYQKISESTPLPMIIYNIPLAGLMGIEFIYRLAEIENVKGVKYTATTHYEIMRLKDDLGSDFKVYSGCDEMAVSGFLFGADGIIGSFYNLMPEVFIDIYNAVIKGDMKTAYRLQNFADIIILKALKYSYLSIIKLGMKWKGVDAGYCRYPFTRYTDAQELDIKNEYKILRDQNNISGVKFLDML